MRIVLRLPEQAFPRLLDHLLPKNSLKEEAAFLFLKAERSDNRLLLDYQDEELLSPSDFAWQEGDYLELKSETRARLIKRAHDLGACLAEIHSHPGPWPAEFSLADRIGLRETVPHMFWRLADRPYVALVVARSGFDALVWVGDAQKPQPLSGLLSGDQLLHPTNLSLGDWQ
jgi:hypothetical protein